MSTGEHQFQNDNVNLNERTSIPAVWAAAIVVAIAGMVFTAGGVYVRIGQLETAIAEEKASHAAAEHESTMAERDHENRLIVLEQHYGDIKDRLGSIDGKLDAMAGVRNTRGHQ